MQTNRFLVNCVLCSGLILSAFFAGCEQKKAVGVPVEFRNFCGELDSLSRDSLSLAEFRALQKEYGRFFELWLMEIMDFSRPGLAMQSDTVKAVYLNELLRMNKPVFTALRKTFGTYRETAKQIEDAANRLWLLLPEKKKPVVYSYFSQFSNYNTFVDTLPGQTILAFSAEMFLGDTFPVYEMLEVPEFFNRYNAPKQVAPMLLWNYLKSRYEYEQTGKTMLDEAVFNGKIWYTLQQVFPDLKPWELFGYKEEEWTRMETEEGQIWRFYLSSNVLFSSDFNAYKRFFNYGTHTFGAGIPPDCPPLIGHFSGYRIVSAYMDKHKTSLPDMWNMKNANDLLRLSGYNPIK
ncbi:MAG: hypothetical protein JNL57_09865 [Bacteroidetes bacterium]|nr:hypothetical protein [Bacteroidota bacterium]